MKKLLSIFSMIFLFFGLQAQQDYDASLKVSFNIYKEAVLKVDRSILLKMEHPNIVKMGGGPAYYVDELTKEYNMYSSTGYSIINLNIKESSKVIEAGKDLQAMVPYVRYLDNGEKAIEEKNYFLATSQDGGANWYFTDMKKYSAESIKVFIPNYNERLNIYLNSTAH